MSTQNILLPPITDRRQSPFYPLAFKNIDASINYSFEAGFNLEVPNHWELSHLSIAYNASAQVGNRQLRGYVLKDTGSTSITTDYFTTEQTIAANENKSFEAVRFTDQLNMQRNDYEIVLLPNSFQMLGKDQLYLYADNDLAGDKWWITLVFRWLNWELGLDYPVLPGKTRQKGWFW